ncbi:fructosamine kinase family protein [Aquibacillus saliphilus]|uniref:fructosamine kinase family protein n=1 Tax=Aquibacillus saliphilus TaxID=1909422 RepID=UPI001CEFCB35|nr:fructosamine kinase family protein [Aquibacillus saliphilus]
MKPFIEAGLTKIGDHTKIKCIKQVSGGDINEAYYVQTEAKQYFIKGNQQVPEHFFRVEAKGLSLIESTKTIHVPYVYYYDEPRNGEECLMILDWIEGNQADATSSLLGNQLAQMHLHSNEQFGFEEDTFVGTLTQRNGYFDSWLTYYQNQRLVPQFELAISRGRMLKQRRERLEKLISTLDKWMDKHPKASLLHGDLWGGNYLTGANGNPYLIDPSVFYGDHAFEIAFTELFGGFSSDFYHAYEEVFPLPRNYQEVKPIYQLYYLLVHLNIFGESYGPSVDRILARYT